MTPLTQRMALMWQIPAVAALCAMSCGDTSQRENDAGQQLDAMLTVDASIADAGQIDAEVVGIEDASTRDAAVFEDAAPADAMTDANPAGSCESAPELLPGVPQQGNTSNLSNIGSASCSLGSNFSKDADYRVLLPQTPTDLLVRVTVEEDVAAPYDTVISVRSVCDDLSSELACADFGYSDSLAALALTDEVFVHVDGTPQFGGAPDGTYEIEVLTRTIQSTGESCDPGLSLSRCDNGLRCVAGTCQTDTIDLACNEATPLSPGIPLLAQTHAFHSDYTQGNCAFDASSGAPEQRFAFTLLAQSDISISTDFPETDFDTVVYLRSICEGADLGCADDVDPQSGNFRSTLIQPNVPAGDYIIIVDGSSTAAPSGTFKIQLDVI